MNLDYIMVCPAPSAVLGVVCLSQGPKAFQGPEGPSLPRATHSPIRTIRSE